MATRTTTTVTINFPPADVYAAFANKAYWDHNTATLSPEPGEVHEFTADDNGAKAVLFEVMPTDMLPEAVSAMISQALKIKRVVNYKALEGTSTEGSYTADVKGAPVDFEGEIALSGNDSSTTLTYNNVITVDIPFMGPAIEPKVADAVGELLANEAKLTEEWISSHS